ncbi:MULTISPECIES: bifunctional hydroxymethylpyrimidine kinase/phosphomethylpyrimidine kinase [Dietzia]|uniref:Bifunctional hydroxymethylpyrimidine kinase/phosphomethylpyrimidine kinase n=1 Tax=Dietzia maris TaxID=37915 RepID=A0ABT8H2N8_9ACTN|nr:MULTISPECIES: bifunctional hydroxymethylpyrimidine kinase/phosphomethylpyrimidine kinase [Dietzia]MBB0995096.1 bifunctional hydroxymethylpyrimidine kinase/phosphomethylpyrimidine kinase [Dietzia sp. SLG510A3-40A3]MBB1009204.1 bifunctional hydroxymethylpyrimidine kinase/phosphomethylpyrimidine kinase [Dietzia sp. SLG510A3-3B2-2]MBB1057470.1 bifunctional hydroxymethylpyrimidine kinase/phosphomethylpyrimidine kinase [Dietzia sp. B19]MBC7308228.1 bifunctional hydroxymethylpyrimidine kinase/phosp
MADGRRPAGARVPRVLCIAGTDPSGGAGLLADTKAVAAMGGYGMGAVTAVTIQNTVGVTGVHAVPVDDVIAQLDAVANDVTIDAVKIGMLGEAALVEAVGDWLRRRRPPHVVLDPVMVATTGGRLASEDAARMLRDLVPLADLVTPNVPELAVLCGGEPAEHIETIVGQAELVHEQTGCAVLATTGDLDDGSAEDVLVESEGDRRTTLRLPFVRVDTPHTHGTGCSLSSALATARVGERDWEAAYRRVRPWIDGALHGGLTLEVGRGSGPLDHTWFLHR